MHERCRGCGTEGKGVEMQGIYCCPNKYCLASGAWGHRIKAGYQDEEGHVSDAQLRKMLVDLRKEVAELRVRLEVLERCEKRLMRYQEGEEAPCTIPVKEWNDFVGPPEAVVKVPTISFTPHGRPIREGPSDEKDFPYPPEPDL